MSNVTEVLYGNRLYGAVTYSDNEDAQTMTENLSDSTSMSDNEGSSTEISRTLTDAETLTDMIAKTVESFYVESQSSSDSRTDEVIKPLPDMIVTGDTFQIEPFWASNETQMMVDATSKTVEKLFIEAPAAAPVLYGVPLYGVPLYGGEYTDLSIIMQDSISFGIRFGFSDNITMVESLVGLQRNKGLSETILIQEWLKFTLVKANIWASQSASAVVESELNLYGSSLYGQPLYSTMPTVEWVQPESPAEAWTNFDNENNQED
jgi:hypothetical protein